MPDGGLSPEDVRAALDELLGWQGISRSPQLAELLRYVVEKTLNGEGAGIKAYSIAVDVFGRPQDFDPQSDPIVRVQARRLRTLLEQFYDGGNGTSGVEIQLPLGRYVPEFKRLEPKAKAEMQPELPSRAPADGAKPGGLRTSRFLTNAALGLVFTLVGVGLTIVAVRWLLPQEQPRVAAMMPEVPRISMGTFDNLTGESVLDDDIRQIGVRVEKHLRQFENLTVAQDGLVLSGSVQLANGQFVLRAMLTLPRANASVWTTTIDAPDGVTDTEALTKAGLVLAAQLGATGGPLHAQARAWLELQDALPAQPTAYVCELVYMRWRDTRRLVDAEEGDSCFNKVLATTPTDALSMAALAGMRAWQVQFSATPGDDLSKQMAEETVAAGRAVTLMPQSSFVYEQQAVVLARQGSLDAALGSIRKAYELNPANMDVVNALAHITWSSGQFAEGVAYGEEALAAIPSPPSRFYTIRAFNALKEQRFFDAIDAAQALASGDEEFGPVIALAAAPRAGRQDLVDRYRPVVMANPHFQVAGILPRVGMRVRTDSLFQRLREGLILAGIPVAALDRPFNADGTERLSPGS